MAKKDTGFWDAFVEALGFGEAPTIAERRTQGLTTIGEWAASTTGDQMRWCCPRAAFAARLEKLVTSPGLMHQGSYPWCMAAAFLFCMLRRYPDLVADYAVGLYDTGTGSIEDFSTSVAAELVEFDLPRYARGELAEHPLPGGRATIDVEHVDWILLAGCVDEAIFPYNHKGPLDFSPGMTGLPSEIEEFFQDTDLYGSVSVVRFPANESAARILAVIAAADVDVVLVGKLDAFAQGLTDSTVDHAAVVTDASIQANGELLVKYWSWGDRLPPDFQAIAEGNSVFSFSTTAQFLRAVSAAVVATHPD